MFPILICNGSPGLETPGGFNLTLREFVKKFLLNNIIVFLKGLLKIHISSPQFVIISMKHFSLNGKYSLYD